MNARDRSFAAATGRIRCAHDGGRNTPPLVDERWNRLAVGTHARAALADEATLTGMARFERHVENFIGTVKVPVGLAGPLRIDGTRAHGEYFVPLATSEATLVASYSRGARICTEAGGCTTAVIAEGMTRSPGFAFRSLREALAFAVWVEAQVDQFRAVVASTTRHGRLVAIRTTVEGNHVYVDFEFATGEAAGQNMVTFATDALCHAIRANVPMPIAYSFLEANHSGDKKASAQSFARVRGKRVCAEVAIPRERVAARLHTTPERMADYWRMAAVGGVLSGTIGVQGHYANALAAFYIACGQDAACVAESAVGVTRFEVTDDGALYAAVTLPNVVVGSVGGGTDLPSQRACLDILASAGPADCRALAEVCAGLALAGELSIIGALCAGEFARAHAELARGRGSTA